jgi:hypothetical protein
MYNRFHLQFIRQINRQNRAKEYDEIIDCHCPVYPAAPVRAFVATWPSGGFARALNYDGRVVRAQ